MITFQSSRFNKTKNGGVYLKYSDIEMLTEEIICDYDKSLLDVPQAIEYDDFLEGYLGVNLEYYDIYTPNSDEVILGCSVFNNQCVPVFDEENCRKTYIECEPNTVILDNSVVSGDRKIQENITGLHEGGHIWLHKDIYTEIVGQTCLDGSNGIICCRRNDINGSDYLGKKRFSNEFMWREWQANVFAVTIALPKKSLYIAAKELFNKHGVDTEVLITNSGFGVLTLANHVIPRELSEIYNMSMESIRYRLERTGLYITKEKYEEEHSNKQMSIFDFIK